MTAYMEQILPFVWKALCIFPVSYRVSPGGDTEARFSMAAFLYGLAVLGVLVPTGVMGLVEDLKGSDQGTTLRMKTTTAVAVTFCDVLSPMVSAAASVLGAVRSGPAVSRLKSRLTIVDSSLGLSPSPPPRYFPAVCFAVFVSISAVDYFAWSNYDGASYLYLPFYVFSLITTALELQFYESVVELRSRFQSLNMKVDQDFLKRGARRNVDLVALPTVETVSYIRTPFNYGKKDEVIFSLSEISDIHWILCGIVSDINNAFGAQLLFVFLYIFLHTIINPYFFVLSLMYPNTYGTGSSILLALQALWMVIHVSELFLLIWPCSSTTEEASKTASLICKYLNRDINPNTRKEVQAFIIQLLHHEAEFSACGLFKLDLTCITAIAGAVTTYLVILIQFQNSDS